MSDKPTSLHSWPFEYDPTPLGEDESHVVVRKGKGRREMSDQDLKMLDKKFPGGATSSKKARYDLIPRRGLKCAADRFQLGLERHPDGCYNALTNQDPLSDKEWLMERLTHVIDHAYKAIEKLSKNQWKEAYGDAGAISFGGLVLGEAIANAENKS